MNNEFIFPKRTIHLDFHTGPDIPDVGAEFDPDDFAQKMKAARVDSVTLFAMCHHGHLYYDTDHPSRHPGLKDGFHLLEKQIEALHKVGIRAPIYLSVLCNEYAANEHPEWVAINSDGRHVKFGGDAFNNIGTRQLQPGWQIMDMSSPYQDFLAEILQEVLDRFAPVDGIFMDMCWDQTSCTKWTIESMLAEGYDPEKYEDRMKHARLVTHRYMDRFRNMVEEAHEGLAPAGIWFNARPKTNLHEEKKFLRHIEIEALPTGGWGYAYFPYYARVVRMLGLPTLSHTGRFFKSWGDIAGLKPKMALKYECCQILSQGMTNGVGDLLHPSGYLAAPIYDLIGDVYAHIEACEPYVDKAKHVSQIGVFVEMSEVESPGEKDVVKGTSLNGEPTESASGMTKALQQLRHQFDVIHHDADLSVYELVIVPELTPMTDDLIARLIDYEKKGGHLIFCGQAALTEEGEPVLETMGIEVKGDCKYRHTFMHVAEEVNDGIEDYGHVMYETGFNMTAKDDGKVLVSVGNPYFERSYKHFSGHDYTPENELSEYAAVVQNGRIITISFPILMSYGKHAAPNYRTLIGNLIDRFIEKPIIKDNGPTVFETTVVDTESSRIVHMLSFSAERRAEGMDIVEDAFPVVDMDIQVLFEGEPSKVFMAPDEEPLDYSYEDGYVKTKVSFTEGHRMLVIEK